MTGHEVASAVADEVLLARAYLNGVAEPTAVPVWALVNEVGPVEAAARIRAQEGLDDHLRAATQARHAVSDPHAALEAGQRSGLRFVVPESDDWPHFGLAPLEFTARERARVYPIDREKYAKCGEPVPPLALWVDGPGDLASLGVRSVGIVGARAASAYGDHIARGLGRGLAEHDVVVVSGGAYGIDAAAHRGALAARGDTVLVSAGGLDSCYPPGNDRLFRAVAEHGLLLSESPPGSAPQRRRFLTRNRLVAALSTGTVVVEAAPRSGALNTVGHCSRLGRPIMAVPGSVESAMSSGCHAVLRNPAWGATLVTSVAEVLEVIGDLNASAADAAGAGTADTVDAEQHGEEPRPGRGGNTRLRRLLDALDHESRTVFDGFPADRAVQIDELVVECGLTPSEVLRSLPVLELAGLIEQRADGFRIRG